jgi:hypothetical protein
MFATKLETLRKYPNSMLGEMFNGQNIPTWIKTDAISSTEVVNISTIFSTL